MKTIYMEMPALGGLVTGVYARGESIPNDRGNAVWREYLAFLHSGGKAHAFDPALEWRDGQWVENPKKRAAFLAKLKVALCNQIDAAADDARRLIVGDPLRAVEYERAASEARTYKTADYAGVIPPSVQSAADAKGLSGQQAADDILTTYAVWTAALYRIRAERLNAKENVRKALDEHSARAARERIVAALQAAVSSVDTAT